MLTITHHKLLESDYDLDVLRLCRDYARLLDDIADVIRGMLTVGLPDQKAVTDKILTESKFNQKFSWTPKKGKNSGKEQSIAVIPRRYIYLAINRVFHDIQQDVNVSYSSYDGVDVDADLVTPKVSKIGEPLKFAVEVKPFGSGIGERLDIPCKAYVGDEDYGVRVGQSRIIPIGSDLHPEFILVSVVEVPEA